MQGTMELDRAGSARQSLSVIAAVAAAFLLGGAGGYLVKGAAVSAVPTASVKAAPASVCPSGTHIVVWYTAQTWSCLSDDTSS